ncbi:hypothetical protein ACNOYE_07655 [Nannocystaceae bacterium ST9]
MRIFALAPLFVLLAACSPAPSTPPTTTSTTGSDPAVEEPEADAGGEAGGDERPGLSAAACEEQGGSVVGDIGDGAIHRPEYRCESGQPPIGSIVADPGGPVAIEGAVCCK